MFFEVNGIKYEGFTSINVMRSLENLCSTFKINATSISDESYQFPIKVGSPCRVLIDDEPILTGYIDIIEISYDNKSHQVSLTGRDKTSDIVDSQIGGVNVEFDQAKVSFEDIVKKILSILNIKDIKYIETTTIKDFDNSEIESASSSQTAFDFLEQYARKRQIILTTDGNGNIVSRKINDGSYKTLLSSQNTEQNNILRASLNFDLSKRFYKYFVTSQGNLSARLAGKAEDPKKTATINSALNIIDNEIRKTREYSFVPEQSTDINQSTERAKWERDYRKTKSIIYKATVQGFYAKDDKEIWVPNKLVQIKDDFCKPNGYMLIGDVTYNYSLDSGSTTILNLYDKDAFTIKDYEPKNDKQSNAVQNIIKELLNA